MNYTAPDNHEPATEGAGLDAALSSLKETLEATWLSGMVFSRAHANTFPGPDGRAHTHPIVYLGNGEYYNCLPNDNMAATVFFRTDGPEQVNLDKDQNRAARPGLALATRPMALIFWGDLTRISPGYGGDYIYTEHIKEEMVRLLHALPCVRSIDEYEDSSLEAVFSGYDFPDDKKQYNKFPYACFRLNFTVSYRLKC